MADTIPVLCLHGYKQNKEIYIKRSGAFRNKLKKVSRSLEFHYLEGQVVLSDETRGWWTFDVDHTCYSGVHEAVELVEHHIKNNNFVGLIGFSQGAGVLSIVLAELQNKKETETLSKIKFVILISGRIPEPQDLRRRYFTNYLENGEKINVPTLHIFGTADELVPWEKSEVMSSIFANSEILKHDGGHTIPSAKEAGEIYTNFVKKCILTNK